MTDADRQTPQENRAHTDAFGDMARVEPERARRLIDRLGPALRALLGDATARAVVSFDDSDEARQRVRIVPNPGMTASAPTIPGQTMDDGSHPLWLAAPEEGEDDEALVGRLRQAIAAHTARYGAAPRAVIIPGLGQFAARRESQPAADRPAGRLAGKVAVVTGAAQGFGREIAAGLAREGALVALADVNQAGVSAAAASLADEVGAGRAHGLAMDVGDARSIAEALHRVIRLWGGFDIFIANAGVLRAGGVQDLTEAEFDLVTRVNYKGYFLCVRLAARVFALQHRALPGPYGDIIQINSKSGLTGSNRNFAYAGGKFGGIGLTQSFALELIADRVKVNAICPGNFFDGPLWSDPENGLFVQYLRAGKVPGARTVDDVRRAYEAKIPMGRGCTAADVLKAILYVIDQDYETGQAIPVTGGQVMLS
ncbi:MAG TPA: SDR family NAD(P)-dependent oxidoreductase [Candidatus Sumerlaeota bacterium]|nr:SDR family NAD(P)-dependent oxidoreductase [Candidatus Sumerlaeota bacterium]